MSALDPKDVMVGIWPVKLQLIQEVSWDWVKICKQTMSSIWFTILTFLVTNFMLFCKNGKGMGKYSWNAAAKSSILGNRPVKMKCKTVETKDDLMYIHCSGKAKMGNLLRSCWEILFYIRSLLWLKINIIWSLNRFIRFADMSKVHQNRLTISGILGDTIVKQFSVWSDMFA